MFLTSIVCSLKFTNYSMSNSYKEEYPRSRPLEDLSITILFTNNYGMTTLLKFQTKLTNFAHINTFSRDGGLCTTVYSRIGAFSV
jgi:hypothetical protein